MVMWVRGAFVVTALLLFPQLFLRLERAMTPGLERTEIAQAIEARQRAAGEVIVLPSGEVRRAVVFTPAHPSANADAAVYRGLTWWSRLLAAVAVLGMLRDTRRLVRQRDGVVTEPTGSSV